MSAHQKLTRATGLCPPTQEEVWAVFPEATRYDESDGGFSSFWLRDHAQFSVAVHDTAPGFVVTMCVDWEDEGSGVYAKEWAAAVRELSRRWMTKLERQERTARDSRLALAAALGDNT